MDNCPILTRPSGFCFDNVLRNATLEKLGVQAPGFKKTGTVIVGVTFKDGVVLGADTRATAGNLIADKHCLKLHRLTDNIYCAGAGTAADLDQVSAMLQSQLTLIELNTGRRARVISALRIAKQHLFRYMGYVGAYLIIGGMDFYGPYLGSVHAHGSTTREPYLVDGSGSLAALSVMEKEFRMDMTEKEAVKLAIDALLAGMRQDAHCGNSYRYVVMKKGAATVVSDAIVPDFADGPPKELKFVYPKNSTSVLKKKEIRFDVVATEKMDTS